MVLKVYYTPILSTGETFFQQVRFQQVKSVLHRCKFPTLRICLYVMQEILSGFLDFLYLFDRCLSSVGNTETF